MRTSYFSKANELTASGEKNLVSIAGKSPGWYGGREYGTLAPKYEWWKQWHDGNLTNDEYVALYKKTTLDKLNPQEVADELGNDAILLCWEASGKFCHRHIVAEWFNGHGIKTEEIDFGEQQNLF